MRERITALEDARRSQMKKTDRDVKIKDRTRVRTYDYTRGCVTDHRTGQKASVKDILEKGELGKLK